MNFHVFRNKKNSIEESPTLNDGNRVKISEKSTNNINSDNVDDEDLYDAEPSSAFSRNSVQRNPRFRVSNMGRQEDQRDSDNESEPALLSQEVEYLYERYNWLENASDSDWNFKNIANFRDCPLLIHLIKLKELATACLNRHVIEKEMVIKIDAIQLRFLLKFVCFPSHIF